MQNNKSNIIIRPEKPSEYETVNQLIYKAFTEQHGMEIGKFMMEHFMGEIRIYMRDLDLNHLVHMGFIMKIEKNGEMKDIWFVY